MNSTNKWDYDHTKHYDTSSGTALRIVEQEKPKEKWQSVQRKEPLQIPKNSKPFSIYETENSRSFGAKPQTIQVSTFT